MSRNLDEIDLKILTEIQADGRITNVELAKRVGISLPSTSHHTAVLREAGLIATRQDGRQVAHVITPLGLALVNGEEPSTERIRAGYAFDHRPDR